MSYEDFKICKTTVQYILYIGLNIKSIFYFVRPIYKEYYTYWIHFNNLKIY